MRVVHISTFESFGGAARASRRLHDGLRGIGVDSKMLVEQEDAPEPGIIRFRPTAGLVPKLLRKARREVIERSFGFYAATRPGGVEIFSDDRSRYGGEVVAQLPACDVVNLHWIASFLDFQAFFRSVPARLPVVWTLHDLNPLTGGCHYTMGCDGLRRGCGACPQLGSADVQDLSRRVLERKRRALEAVAPHRLRLVTPSRWLATEARQSQLGRVFAVSVIPYGLDLSVFAPRDRRAAREVLGVPHDARVILFLAQDVEKERKGRRLLEDALGQVDGGADGTFLISVGRGATGATKAIPGVAISQVGDDRLLSSVYSAADVFVLPSREDNLPNTVLEAMACGVPVVAFAVGGVTDMVRPGTTGVLVPPFDTRALAAEIQALLADTARRRELACNCRRIAEEEYGLELQARRYSELYEDMLHSRA